MNDQKPDSPPSTKEFYDIVKSQISAENDLINNRVTWLLTFQGFLFSAYGLSLPAQATILASVKTTYNMQNTGFLHQSSPLKVIGQLRQVIAWLGMGASFALLFGTGAAAIAIIHLLNSWRELKSSTKNEFPAIAGNGIPGLGAYAGLIPTYSLPLTTAWGWDTIAHSLRMNQAFGCILGLAATGLIYMFYIDIRSRLKMRSEKNSSIA